MTLGELLAELRGNILRDVSTIVDGSDSDDLWTDESLIRYIRDAEEKFAAGTLCLRDSVTAALAQITLVAGQGDYTLDRRVIAIYSAQYNGNIQMGRCAYGTRFGAGNNVTPTTAYREPQGVGEPRIYYTDRDTGMVGFYPTPGTEQAGDIVRLQVARRPLVPLSKNDLEAEPEIPEEYHLDLLEWATWRALRNHDADIDGDPANISIVMARVSAHKKRFEDAIAECKRKAKYMSNQHVEFGVRANWS